MLRAYARGSSVNTLLPTTLGGGGGLLRAYPRGPTVNTIFPKHLPPPPPPPSAANICMQDTLPIMREQSVKASLSLVKKLNDRTVNTILLKHFAKLQVDPEPGIRVNTTICLGVYDVCVFNKFCVD